MFLLGHMYWILLKVLGINPCITILNPFREKNAFLMRLSNLIQNRTLAETLECV